MRSFVNTKQQLKKRISQIELQIRKLNVQSASNSVCDDLYNSLILQKAVLKKQLQEQSKNRYIERLKKFLPRKEKLICDYFN